MRYKNIKGQQFGFLTAIEKVDPPSNYKNTSKAFWKCRCICNNEIVVLSEALRNGRTKSCGCKKGALISSKSRLSNKGQAGFNRLLQRYKRQARSRNIKFNLSIEEFRKLTSSQCFFCNKNPEQISNLADVQGMTQSGIKFGAYKYNGIDRLNPNGDYEQTNVVACCKICNRIKSDMTLQELEKHLRSMLTTRFE